MRKRRRLSKTSPKRPTNSRKYRKRRRRKRLPAKKSRPKMIETIMRPLDGITVLDLTRLLPGAVATMMLGDFGADIIKVEEPSIGDPARQSRAGIKRPG